LNNNLFDHSIVNDQIYPMIGRGRYGIGHNVGVIHHHSSATRRTHLSHRMTPITITPTTTPKSSTNSPKRTTPVINTPTTTPKSSTNSPKKTPNINTPTTPSKSYSKSTEKIIRKYRQKSKDRSTKKKQECVII